jgi:5-formyltetrahydrofolate cyclo-ligase
LRKRGVRIAYPRIEAPGVLGMHFVDHEMELVPGPFGLAQPSEHAPHVPHDRIDAVVIPGVAFDEQGTRLGYGGGYYDRLLPMMRPECMRIGVAFDEQVLAHIPAEEHDAFVDVLVTPTRIIRPDTPRRF